MSRRFGVLVLLTVLTIVAFESSPRIDARQRDSAATTSTSAGPTRTTLGDGRMLVLGGETATGPVRTASIVDPVSQQTTVLPAGMIEARALHSATLLPDGSVLIVGGRTIGGRTLATAERFDPETNTFAPLPISAAAAHAGHTATVLTDGRVLIVGGASGDPSGAAAEVWDVDRSTVAVVAGGDVRSGHAARLLADGRVLIDGGVDANGRPQTGAEIFTPGADRFSSAVPTVTDDGNTPAISAAFPSVDARDVPVDIRLALRFSRPLIPSTVTETTVALSSDQGPVSVRVTPAEAGRLAFISPSSVLAPNTTYTLVINGPRDARGAPLNARLTFTTADDPKDRSATDAADEEVWLPDADAVQNGWKTNRPKSSWESLPPLQAAPGVTAVAGQVLTLDGRPLRGVTLEIDEQETQTDNTGRFLLELRSGATARHELEIEGATANRGQRRYGFFEYGMTVTAARTNVLPFTIWMPRLDTAHEVVIPSPTIRETIITTPYIPGLELHLPAGTVIAGEDGKPVTKLGITPIPVDRPPFPLAANVEVPVYFTVQPGGAYLATAGAGPKGGWLVYPNYRHEYAGKRMQFFHYDPEEKGWYVYGLGTVTPTATQVVPDTTTRIYELTGAMINGGGNPGGPGRPPGDKCCNDSDPVNLATGLFVEESTDLVVPDVLPLAVTRTYRSRDLEVRQFGYGTTHPYGMLLWSALQYQEADLVLPDGGRVHYVRTSLGTGWSDAVFTHQESATTSATPTEFYKSTIKWNGNGWDLVLKNGTVYVFGENAPLQAIRDRLGNTIKITRDNGQRGNITQVTSPNGRWLAFSYDGSGRITQARDNIGRTVAYTYDTQGNLATVTLPGNYVTSYTYDSSHRMLTIKTPNLQGTPYYLVTNEYETAAGAATLGWVKKQTFADAGVYQFTYTVVNGKSTQTDVTNPRGYVRRVTMNSDGYVLSDTRALGQPEQQVTSSSRLAGSNFVTSHTNVNGDQTTSTFDALGNLATYTVLAGTPDAKTTTYTYESRFNQIETITDPLNHVTSFSYDADGNLSMVTDPLNHSTSMTYNAAGQITTVTDALMHSVTLIYAQGDLIETINPLGIHTSQLFDTVGRLISKADGLGRKTEYEYDGIGRVVRVTDPEGGATNVTYFPGGQVQTVTDARNHATSFTYDRIGRQLTRTDPLGRVETLEYDPAGNLIRHTDRKSQVTLRDYDALDRLHQITYADGTTIVYTYDAGGRVTHVADSANGTIVRQYDALDRLTSETTPQGSISYTYDALGRRETMTVAGQPTVTYSYDAASRLAQITQNGVSTVFDYDAADRRTMLTLPNGLSTEYGYDDASQVVAMTYRQGASTLGDLTYAYDAAGNRMQVGGAWARTGLPQPAASIYDDADQIQQSNGIAFDFDPNGNVVADGANLYTWNARNQLASISGSTTATFQYDGVGRRIMKSSFGATTSYLYDVEDVVQELNGSTVNRVVGGTDEWYSFASGATTWTPFVDALGSTIALADGLGGLAAQYTYEPFGNSIVSGASTGNAFLFTGREDEGNGLYYYRARYYQPSLGRFLSEDVFSEPRSAYAYVGNSPPNFTDPTGWMQVETGGIMESIVDQGAIPLGAVAMTKVAAVLLCYCTCEGGSYKLHGILRLYGSMLLPRTVTRVPKVDKSVVDTATARNHEYSWHINPAIAKARKVVEPAEARSYPSEEACNAQCKELQSKAPKEFNKQLQTGQRAENAGIPQK
jgi:RHS repeat-associated protein